MSTHSVHRSQWTKASWFLESCHQTNKQFDYNNVVLMCNMLKIMPTLDFWLSLFEPVAKLVCGWTGDNRPRCC